MIATESSSHKFAVHNMFYTPEAVKRHTIMFRVSLVILQSTGWCLTTRHVAVGALLISNFCFDTLKQLPAAQSEAPLYSAMSQSSCIHVSIVTASVVKQIHMFMILFIGVHVTINLTVFGQIQTSQKLQTREGARRQKLISEVYTSHR